MIRIGPIVDLYDETEGTALVVIQAPMPVFHSGKFPRTCLDDLIHQSRTQLGLCSVPLRVLLAPRLQDVCTPKNTTPSAGSVSSSKGTSFEVPSWRTCVPEIRICESVCGAICEFSVCEAQSYFRSLRTGPHSANESWQFS